MADKNTTINNRLDKPGQGRGYFNSPILFNTDNLTEVTTGYKNKVLTVDDDGVIALTAGGDTAISASYAVSASQAQSSSYATTASYSLNSIPAFPYTGSALVTGSLGITGSLSSTGNVVLTGLINQTTAQNFVVTFNNTTGQLYITASSAFGGGGGGGSTPGGPYNSIQYNNAGVLDGSSIFNFNGTTVQLTGSLLVSGSTTFTGSVSSLNGFSGSLFGTASWASNSINAITASYVSLAQTASYVLNAVSASFATTSSFALNSISASYALTSSFASNASSASYALSSSFASNAFSSSYALSASFASTSFSSVSSSYSTTAFYALSSLSASYARTASFISPLTQSFSLLGSATITGSTEIYGNFLINNATLVDINTSVLNINAPTFQVPSFALPYSPSINVRTVMYDAVSNALFVTSSLPGTGGNTSFISTGSISASVNLGTPNFFSVSSASIDLLKIDTNKVLVLVTQSSAPTPVNGGIFVSSSGDFFFGI
jgi:hypothetical protein